MAGLPLLIMAGNAALTALISLSQRPPNLTLAIGCAALSLLLIMVAFRIRAGKSGWMPLVLAAFAVFLANSAFAAHITLMAVGVSGMGGVQIVTGWIVPLICSVLVVAGVKGWIWLKAEGLPRPL